MIDLVIKNGYVFDEEKLSFVKRDLYVNQGVIVDETGKGAKKVIDASGKYLIPGLIDSHMHMESTLLSPYEYSRASLKNGVLTAIADCHEIANVLGKQGLDFIINELDKTMIDIKLMLPSSVPCSIVSKTRHALLSADLKPYYDNKHVHGLGEVMDIHRIINQDKDYTQKVLDAIEAGKCVDGHMPHVTLEQLEILTSVGIKSDHECEDVDDMINKLNHGMNIFIREGSATKNFDDLMPGVTVLNNEQISFCTDDLSVVDLVNQGSINNIIKKGIKQGYAKELLIKMASFNAAKAYGLNKGSLKSGYIADVVILNDVDTFDIEMIVKDGELIDPKVIDYDQEPNLTLAKEVMDTVDIAIDSKAIDLEVKHDLVIGVKPDTILTHCLKASECDDLSKIVVINRYGEEKYFVGYVSGFNLKQGSIATTVSHDCHNVVIVGNDDNLIREMIDVVKDSVGGMFYLDDKLTRVDLDIAGLTSSKSIKQVYDEFSLLEHTIDKVTSFNSDLLLNLSFLTLDVIPTLKITDSGLYHFFEEKLYD